jgi:hypothetical protein
MGDYLFRAESVKSVKVNKQFICARHHSVLVTLSVVMAGKKRE